MKEDAKRREQNNPMKVCVLKYDHFENIHRLDAKLPSYEGAPNFRQVAYALSAWIARINNYDNVESRCPAIWSSALASQPKLVSKMP